MLAAMFSGRHAIKRDKENRVFIDRDGKYFAYILEFLRNGSVILPKDPTEIRKIKKETEFFGLSIPGVSDPMPELAPEELFFKYSGKFRISFDSGCIRTRL